MDSLTVNVALAADLPELVELLDLYRQFYAQPSDLPRARAFLAERLKRQDSLLLVAKHHHEMLGFVQVYPLFSSIQTETVWLLNDLFVKPTGRGAGVGTALLHHMRREASERGVCTIRLSTKQTNVAAQRLYEANGYVADSGFRYYSLSTS